MPLFYDFVAFLFVPIVAWAQGNPLGPEFRVNAYTTNPQFRPSVASDTVGNFVVVWTSGTQDGSGFGVFGQRYDSSGTPLGPEFQVNTYTTNSEYRASVATDITTGDFVVVWESFGQDGSEWGVFGQRYDVSGTPLGPEFRVNTYTTSYQLYPSVARGPSGNFVVVWHSVLQDGSSFGVFGQRYAGSGAPLGPEFQVNTYVAYAQSVPSVAADSAGNFIVVWASGMQDGSGSGIFGQRYASSGAPLGPEFRVNTYTTNTQAYPFVAADTATGNFVVVWNSGVQVQDGSAYGVFGQRFASSGAPLGPEFRVNTYTTAYQYSLRRRGLPGNLVVVWESSGQDGSSGGVFGQRFASSGAPLGPEFRVNTYTTNDQRPPSVASDTAGNFVVVWSSYPDGSEVGVYAQRYASSGSPSGPEFRVNTYTTYAQVDPSVGADSSGNFVVVWQSDTQDGSDYGVYGQRYGQIVPVELMRFSVE
jgi:hypothetical protein